MDMRMREVPINSEKGGQPILKCTQKIQDEFEDQIGSQPGIGIQPRGWLLEADFQGLQGQFHQVNPPTTRLVAFPVRFSKVLSGLWGE